MNLFKKSTLQVAKDLLGMHLTHHSPEGLAIGRIVETEAYLREDPASHSFRGKTPRNAAMFGPPGRAYIYFIYGTHHCFNIVTAPEGKGEAVLIRALEPVTGIELMEERRSGKSGKTIPLKELCNGPAKLVVALGIHPGQSHCDLLEGELRLLPRNYFGARGKISIVEAKRIGIQKAAELPYRFYIRGNPFVSKA